MKGEKFFINFFSCQILQLDAPTSVYMGYDSYIFWIWERKRSLKIEIYSLTYHLPNSRRLFKNNCQCSSNFISFSFNTLVSVSPGATETIQFSNLRGNWGQLLCNIIDFMLRFLTSFCQILAFFHFSFRLRESFHTWTHPSKCCLSGLQTPSGWYLTFPFLLQIE